MSRWVEEKKTPRRPLRVLHVHTARPHHTPNATLTPLTTQTRPSQGGYGSLGYGCEFQRGEAMKNLLRTHTTAVSARMLYRCVHRLACMHARTLSTLWTVCFLDRFLVYCCLGRACVSTLRAVFGLDLDVDGIAGRQRLLVDPPAPPKK